MSKGIVLWVTSAAAKRLGLFHPANQPKHDKAELPGLYKILNGNGFGEMEKEQAYNRAVLILVSLQMDADAAISNEARQALAELHVIRAQSLARFNGALHG